MNESSPAGMPTVLEQIVERRKRQAHAAYMRYEDGETPLTWEGERRDFVAALLRAPQPVIIAELKRASPSRGRIREDFDVAKLAAAYQHAGAAALSVLTEPDQFQGKLEYLLEAKRAAARLPVLRKDFIVSEFQVRESAWAGADAILLIAEALEPWHMGQLIRLAHELQMAVLCEVRTPAQLEQAAGYGADLVGINSRNLHDFSVDLARAEKLGPWLPPQLIGVAESGLRHGADLARMARAGYQAFLIGEGFMAEADPGAALAALRRQCQPMFVKICGLRTLADARQACQAGADAVGFVFAEGSPRQVNSSEVQTIVPHLPVNVLRVGVFRGAPVSQIAAIAHECGLNAVQLHGDYSEIEAGGLAKKVAVWRAVAMPGELFPAMAWAPVVERFVLDSPTPGSGEPFPWDAAKRFLHHLGNARRQPPVLLAGGLTPENVLTALRASGVDGADVASGVEASPGVKDHEKVTSFCRNARRAFRAREISAGQ